MLEVVFTLLLHLLQSFGALFLDDLHVGLERLFIVVGQDLVFVGVSSGLKIFLLLLVALSNVEAVECSFQMVYFVFVGSLISLRKGNHTVEDLLF